MGRLESVLRAALPGEPARLSALDAAVRAPLPLSTAVGVLGAGPDAPTAVVGGLLAAVLAARRPHRVLAVAAQPARPGIGRYAGLDTSATPTDAQIATRAAAGSGAEATAGLAQASGGSWVLDLAAEPARWWEAVAPISRFFDFVVTDWGAGSDLADARATSAVLLVVSAANRTALQSAVDLAARLATPGVRPLLAVHDSGVETERSMPAVAAINDAHWLPADRALRTEPPTPSSRLHYGTATAVLDLASAVVRAAAARNGTELTR